MKVVNNIVTFARSSRARRAPDHSLRPSSVTIRFRPDDPVEDGRDPILHQNVDSTFGRKRLNAEIEGVASTVSPMERRRTNDNIFLTSRQFQRACPTAAGRLDPATWTLLVFRWRANVEKRQRFCEAVHLLFLRWWPRLTWHDRDVVTDGVNSFAFDAFQCILIRLEFNLCFTCGTREYLQEFLTNSHWS